MPGAVEPLPVGKATSFEELRQAVVAPPEAAAEESVESLLTFQFRVTDHTTNPARSGVFTSEVPTTETRINVARTRSVLSGGAEWHTLPGDDQSLIDSIALTTWCLTEKPAWFEDPMGARNPLVIMRVGEEIRAHHARFFRALAPVGENGKIGRAVVVEAVVGK